MTQLPISLCIINKNDDNNLEDLLVKARPWVKEIVVVDTGSDSLETAKKHADIVFDGKHLFQDEHGRMICFSKARQQSFDLASQPWLFWLDTDDKINDWSLLPEFLETLQTKLELKQPTIGWMYYDYTWNKDKTECTQTIDRERIVHRDWNPRWKRPVHEHIKCFGIETKILSDKIRVIHKSLGSRGQLDDRNLCLIQKWKTFKPDDTAVDYYLADELLARNKWEEAIPLFIKASTGTFFPERAMLRACICAFNSQNFPKFFDLLTASGMPFANYDWLLVLFHLNHKNYKAAREHFNLSKTKPMIEGEDNTYPSQFNKLIELQPD